MMSSNSSNSVRWSIRRHAEGRGGDVVYTGEILLPGNWQGIIPGAPRGQSYLQVQSAPVGSPLAPSTPGQALSQAGSLASKILSNPILQAALPPGAGMATAAIQYLAESDTVGNLANAAKDIVGEGAKRIASALKFW
jgi:hypothetical protein